MNDAKLIWVALFFTKVHSRLTLVVVKSERGQKGE